MKNHQDNFAEARRLYGLGFSPRQIAARLDLLPSVVKQHAAAGNWPAGQATDWQQLRQRFEQGEDITDIAANTIVSKSTLQKRKLRENWNRVKITGIDALRRSVSALQSALANAPEDDPVLTTRISTALSMAAGRLSRAEGDNSSENLEQHEEELTDHDFAIGELGRLMQDWRDDK